MNKRKQKIRGHLRFITLVLLGFIIGFSGSEMCFMILDGDYAMAGGFAVALLIAAVGSVVIVLKDREAETWELVNGKKSGQHES